MHDCRGGERSEVPSGNESDPASSVCDLNTQELGLIKMMYSGRIYDRANPSDDTGLNFIFFDWATDGSKQEFGPELEYRAVSGLRTEFAYTDPESGEDEQITRPISQVNLMSLIHRLNLRIQCI